MESLTPKQWIQRNKQVLRARFFLKNIVFENNMTNTKTDQTQPEAISGKPQRTAQ